MADLVSTKLISSRAGDDRDISGGSIEDAKRLIENCEYEIYSMFGIKRDRTSVHSIYKIGRIIGDGNFAIVRECRNRKTQKTFALKVINKAKVKGKEHMIENEILILRKISHPNIVKLHEEFETPKEIYLVMELVSGGDLFDAIVANTRFSEPDSAYMVRDLASAVQYLHDMDIVHRDIKPENLLVVNRADGRKSIKLADFGLSIEVKSPMFLVCGTPTYVAPEILDESGYGIKVDVWAIGVICYILLCGFPPFRSANHDQEELFDKILHGDFEYLSPFWDDVSEGPRDLIDRLLVVDASERYEASEILTHPWVKKWTEPVEKIHRELSEAEEADKQNRKRLRGIAIAIHSVISLLRYVRAKRKHIDCESSKSTNPNSLSLTETKLNSRTTPNISRIPRPKPSAGLHIAEIRKSITTPIKRRKASKSNSHIPSALKTTGNGPAPDYSLKKGFLKREEAIQRAFIRMNCAQSPTKKVAAKTILTESPGPTRRNSKSQGVTEKHVKFRPASSVLELRQSKEKLNATNRPSSAQSLRSLSKKSANVVKTTPKTLKSSVSKPEISKSGTKQKASASIDKSSKPSVSTSDLRGGTPTNGVRLRQKTARPRPRSMIETKVTSKSIDEFLQIHDLAPVAEHQATKVSRSDSIKSTHSESPTEQLKKSARKPRPTSLVIKNNPTATSKSRPKAMTPNSTSSNSDTVRRSFQSLECLSVDENILNASFESTDKRACSPRRKSRNDSVATQDPMFFGKFSTTRTSSPASKVPVSMVGQTKKVSTPTRKDSSPQRCHSASRSRNHSSSTPVTKGGTHTRRKSVSDSTPWNSSTRTGTPTSPKRLSDKKYKRSLSEQSKSIKITAEINKRKNIKFPDGKTVDKEVKTTTTFSLDMPDSEEERTNQSSSSLLTKVKNLAHEIENLSKDNCRLSDSSSDSITNNTVTVSKPRTSHDNNDRDVINEETDRFSETEYLSVFGKAGSELNS